MWCYEVVRSGEPLQGRERPTPSPRGREVLVRVQACGVCHSDIHIWDGYYDLGGGRKLSLEDRGIKPPIVMGHETVGTVAAVGPEVRDLAIGETRLVFPWIGCGRCSLCATGDDNLCPQPRSLGIYSPGGYADHILVPDAKYLVPINGLDPAEAAPFACSGVTAYSALKKLSGLRPDDRIAILGIGGVGLAAMYLARAMYPDNPVIAIDVDPKKRAIADAAGAAATLDAREPDAAERLALFGQGRLGAAVDFVGARATAELAIGGLRKGGHYVIVGLYGGDLPLSLPLLPLRGLTVQGSYVGSLQDMRELMELARRQDLPRVPITRRPLDQADASLRDLKAGNVVGRVVLTP